MGALKVADAVGAYRETRRAVLLEQRMAVRRRVNRAIGSLDIILDDNWSIEELRARMMAYRGELNAMATDIDKIIRRS
jgi:hypothetical protein